MREILFRGKRKDNNEWAFGYLFDDGMVDSDRIFIGGIVVEDYKGNADDIFDITGIGFCEVIPKTVCQYAGLTDKNGRKIFEGDIITYQHDNDDCPFSNKDTKRRVGRVYFQEFRSCFAVAEGKNGSDMINQDLFKYVQNGNRVEVIGNIFDNPELIDGEKVWD